MTGASENVGCKYYALRRKADNVWLGSQGYQRVLEVQQASTVRKLATARTHRIAAILSGHGEVDIVEIFIKHEEAETIGTHNNILLLIKVLNTNIGTNAEKSRNYKLIGDTAEAIEKLYEKNANNMEMRFCILTAGDNKLDLRINREIANFVQRGPVTLAKGESDLVMIKVAKSFTPLFIFDFEKGGMIDSAWT